MKKQISEAIRNTPDTVLLGVVTIINQDFSSVISDEYNPHIVIIEYHTPVKPGASVIDSINKLKMFNPKLRVIYYYGSIEDQKDFERVSEILIENEITEIIFGEECLKRLCENIQTPMTPDKYIEQFACANKTAEFKFPQAKPPQEEELENIAEDVPIIRLVKPKKPVNSKYLLIGISCCFILAVPTVLLLSHRNEKTTATAASTAASSDSFQSTTTAPEGTTNATSIFSSEGTTTQPTVTVIPQNTTPNVPPVVTTKAPSVTTAPYAPPYNPIVTQVPVMTTTPVTTARPIITTAPVTTAPVTTTATPTAKPVVTTTKAPVVTTPPTPTIPVLINTISLSHYSPITLKAGQTFKVVPKILPSNATNKTLAWVSASPLVATVSSDGTVTARSSGKAIITCWTTDGTNLSASCMVTVQ